MGLGLYVTDDIVSSLMRYSFNMPIFFFVSGFLAYKESDLGKLNVLNKLRDKFLYLALPAIVFAIFSKLYDHNNVLEILSNGFGKYWFTIVLFEMFVLFYIAMAFSHSKLKLIFILSVLSILGVGYLGLFSGHDIALLDFNRLSKYLQYFTIGVIARMFPAVYERYMKSDVLKFITTGGFFILLVFLFYDIVPPFIDHFLRDIVLRWLGTFMIVSWFYNNNERFEPSSPMKRWISRIGQNSLAIYLLQYFFLPDLKTFPKLIEGMDAVCVHIFSFMYAIIITIVCLIFIELLSNSTLIRKYVLGRR